ncbi:AMP-binding protein [Bacillus solimangrovi]|uniref:AMP-dependent synthetase n=1 Tax=Bacillus solimangrovi TaxID=1305675 RepID=A0A1E5LCM1_9BACI|nr:AMP-binding protein [Bacillus solimangrovi]OEH91832.1 AMP-dependent synthetase [Bacillus solimangrovi]
MIINEMNRVAIGDIIRRTTARFPEKVAIKDRDIQLTYKQLNDLCNQYANHLLNNGYKKGDCIATIAGNSYEHIIAIYGIAKAGLTWVPINPMISIEEKKYILNEVKASTILDDPLFLNKDSEHLQQHSLFYFDNNSSISQQSFLSAFVNESSNEPRVDIQDRDTAQIMFTSGTTGNPKGVMISHLSVYMSSLTNIIEINLSPQDKPTIMMPIFHCAQHTFLTSFLNIGATNVVINGFDPESLMALIEKERINFMFALPMMYKALLYHPKRAEYNLSSLKTCVYAMAPIDRESLEKAIQEFDADFHLGTGQTEMYPATMIFKSEEQLRRFGSYWGTSSLINDTAIMDDEGNFLTNNQVGEIVHRGPNVMNGYLNNKEATEQTRRSGWHHTGDLGYWDEDGQMVFVDRKKDVIKTGGENVASIKVEQTILNHHKVENVVVVGLPHEKWNEAVTAFIIPKKDAELTKEEIIIFCKRNLGSFQVPKDVLFVDELPMTSTGKIQKHKVRSMHTAHYKQVNKMG